MLPLDDVEIREDHVSWKTETTGSSPTHPRNPEASYQLSMVQRSLPVFATLLQFRQPRTVLSTRFYSTMTDSGQQSSSESNAAETKGVARNGKKELRILMLHG